MQASELTTRDHLVSAINETDLDFEMAEIPGVLKGERGQHQSAAEQVISAWLETVDATDEERRATWDMVRWRPDLD